MWLDKWIKDDSGFSLIEVVLAVTILALVALPIINYFTYSSVQTIEGRDKQSATMVAENVIEELSSYSNYAQVKGLTATPDPAGPVSSSAPVWQNSSPKPGESPDPNSDYIERTVTVNGFEYLAKVQIQYGVYVSGTKALSNDQEKPGSGTGDARSPKYNDYYIPSPSEVYAPSNAVAEEDDELDIALSDLYSTLNASGAGGSSTSVDMATIRAGLTRQMYVDMAYKNSDKKEYLIQVYYEYSYGGQTVKSMLEKAEIAVDLFKGVFVFYNPLVKDSTEEINVNVDSEIPIDVIEKMEFYFAVQDAVQSTYSLKVNTLRATDAKYFANDINLLGVVGNLQEGASVGSKLHSFVGRKQTERIGRIAVDVYETQGKNAGESVAHMETTMAE